MKTFLINSALDRIPCGINRPFCLGFGTKCIQFKKKVSVEKDGSSKREQTPRGILTGHSIHIHFYRIKVRHVVSCTAISADTLVADTRAGLISQQ